MKRMGWLFVLLAALSVGACGRAAVEATPTSSLISGMAQVNDVEIQKLESMPLLIQVIARGTLPDGCTTVSEVSVSRAGNEFNIRIETSRPAQAVCTEVIVPFERVIPLESEGLPAGEYKVTVNGVSESFELAADNLATTPTPVDDASAAISGLVWHDLCGFVGTAEGEPTSVSEGCVETDPGGFEANGVLDADEPGIEGLLVELGEGVCPSDGLATATTAEDGRYSFTGLRAGTYCVSVEPLEPQNEPILVPGIWTHPTGGDGSQEVTLEIGEDRRNVNLGWDYQFLPALNAEGCTDQAAFVADVTVPDDSVFAPGTRFTKTWRLRNEGTCTWGPDYFLVFVGGNEMSGDAVSLPVVPPEQTVELSVDLTAPQTDGTYRGDWQLQNPDRELFGIGPDFNQTFFLQIVVDSDLPAGGLIQGRVWDDACELVEGEPSAGCVEMDGDFQGDGVQAADETGIEGVAVSLFRGECPATGEVLETVTTARNGIYRFAGLEAGGYCVSIDTDDPANADILGAGVWTFSTGEGGQAAVTVESDQGVSGIDFGWDEQPE